MKKRDFIAIGSGLMLSVVLFGCGSADETAAQPAQAAAPQPQAARSINDVCNEAGGTIQGSKCLVNKIAVVPGSYYNLADATFPVLSASKPGGPSPSYFVSGDTKIHVEPGDKLVFKGSGKWGAADVNTKKYLGGFFVYQSVDYDCNDVNHLGQDGDEIKMNEGLPAGLVFSDGTEVFALGDIGPYGKFEHTIANSGNLRFGFNTPETYGLCGSLSVSEFRVSYCIDATGARSSCE